MGGVLVADKWYEIDEGIAKKMALGSPCIV